MLRALCRLLTLEAVERRPGRVILAIGLTCAFAYVTALTLAPRSHGRLLNGDAIQYYVYLRSLVIDGDLDFTNDYARLYAPSGAGQSSTNVWVTSTTPIGRPPNQMAVGPALLWSPFFLITHAVLGILRLLGLTRVPLDGFAAPYAAAAGLAGIACAAIGAWFCYRACRALVPDAPAIWAALTAWLASPVVYYSVVSPTYSHAPSMMACAIFADVWLRSRGDARIGRDVRLGLLGGLAALVRWQDAVILMLPGLELAAAVLAGRRRLASAARSIVVIAVMFAVGLLPQLLAWHAVYGQYVVMPQGEGFMRWTSPAVWSVLFSLRQGLLSWTPALAAALAGLWLLGRRDSLTAVAAAAVIAVTVYVNASVNDWWAGAAFGARRFAGNTVLFAWGFAGLFAADVWSRRPWLRRAVAAALILYNLLFLVQYALFMRGVVTLAPFPSSAQQIFIDRLTLPWRALMSWLQ